MATGNETLRAGNASSISTIVRTPPSFHYLLGRIHGAYWD